MDSSIFTDKAKMPQQQDLAAVLGAPYQLWQDLCEMTVTKYPAALSEWYFPGAKWGWNFRIKDKKRAIVYLLPREHSFLAAFVFGKRAYEKVMESTLSKAIKDDLQAARPYAEGRGIRIEVKAQKTLRDLDLLVDIKLAY
jgi:hypothetical protein